MAALALGCLLVVLLAGGCGGDEPDAAPRPVGPRLTAAVERRLDAELRRTVEESGVVGASAAIVFPDGRIWRGAAASPRWSRPAR